MVITARCYEEPKAEEHESRPDSSTRIFRDARHSLQLQDTHEKARNGLRRRAMLGRRSHQALTPLQRMRFDMLLPPPARQAAPRSKIYRGCCQIYCKGTIAMKKAVIRCRARLSTRAPTYNYRRPTIFFLSCASVKHTASLMIHAMMRHLRAMQILTLCDD